MAERQEHARIERGGADAAVRRRGILAAAGAVAAALVAKQVSQPVQAAYTLLGDTTNNSTTTTTITGAIGSIGTLQVVNTINTSGTALAAHCDSASYGFGIKATGTGYGIYATGDAYAGVFGDTSNSVGAGVVGLARSSQGGIGVSGTCDAATGVGVLGSSNSGTGVRGIIPTGNSATNTIAVFGSNQSTGTGGVGVRGDCPSGNGVLGQSTTGVGVYGATVSGLYGIVGQSGTAVGSAGLLGVANGPNAVGFGTIAQNGATFAGYFNGTTVVNGTFAVTGSKSAAVKDAAGEYRLMYCVEAPEAWFEDFGTGNLVNGSATVRIDPQFAQHIQTNDYHVFLTPYGASQGLDVVRRDASGFVVQERNGGTSGAAFGYRIVGRRADIAGERLGKFTMPPGLKLPDVPPPAPPAPPVAAAPQPAPPPRPSQSVSASPAAAPQGGGPSPTVQPAPAPRP